LDLQINKKRCYPLAIVIWDELCVAVRHISTPPTGFPRLKERLAQLWKGRAVEDALP
jgi:hypothetical protein